jgi:hypothetical protein
MAARGRNTSKEVSLIACRKTGVPSGTWEGNDAKAGKSAFYQWYSRGKNRDNVTKNRKTTLVNNPCLSIFAVLLVKTAEDHEERDTSGVQRGDFPRHFQRF